MMLKSSILTLGLLFFYIIALAQPDIDKENFLGKWTLVEAELIITSVDNPTKVSRNSYSSDQLKQLGSHHFLLNSVICSVILLENEGESENFLEFLNGTVIKQPVLEFGNSGTSVSFRSKDDNNNNELGVDHPEYFFQFTDENLRLNQKEIFYTDDKDVPVKAQVYFILKKE